MNRFKVGLIVMTLSVHLIASESICPIIDCSKVISDYGQTINKETGKIRLHTGIDFVAVIGSKVYAVEDGKVLKSSEINGYGKRIVIKHKNSFKTLYAHLLKLNVKKGQFIKKGDIIGYSGNSGKSYGPHLHFGVYKNDRMINPKLYLGKLL